MFDATEWRKLTRNFPYEAPTNGQYIVLTPRWAHHNTGTWGSNFYLPEDILFKNWPLVVNDKNIMMTYDDWKMLYDEARDSLETETPEHRELHWEERLRRENAKIHTEILKRNQRISLQIRDVYAEAEMKDYG